MKIVQNSPFGIVAPASTSPEVVNQVHDAPRKRWKSPGYVVALRPRQRWRRASREGQLRPLAKLEAGDAVG
ncbi:tripartite tricarboxylate transporter substrate-binding protein [Variovorax sp. J22R187]|nr:tripartite tricarboxylate transporter substrate-binding protein [Variovorax sp. J22R187]MDM0021926.1 tripartite tricarboxylate transporter substrate-binding protein [Variovorax sp. J22R187]